MGEPSLVTTLLTRSVECIDCTKELWREPIGRPRHFHARCEQCVELDKLERTVKPKLQGSIRCGYSFSYRLLSDLEEATDKLAYLRTFQVGVAFAARQYRLLNPEAFARMRAVIAAFSAEAFGVGPPTAEPERGGR